MSNTAPHRRHLNVTAAAVHDGLMGVRAVTDHDRALDAGFKAVMMAAAAAAQRDGSLASRELARASQLGVGAARVWAAAAVVLSSRGEGAYERFSDAACDHFGVPSRDATPRAPAGDDAEAAERAEAFLAARSGTLPEYARLLRDFAPEALVGYARLLEAAWHQAALSASEVQLILVCLNAAACRADFTAHHSLLARGAGASDGQIIEAGVCAIPCGGVTAWYATGGELLQT